MRKNIGFIVLFICLCVFYVLPVKAAEEPEKKSRFLLLPMAGWINSDVQFTSQQGSPSQTLKDNGHLYGLYTIYADSDIAIGSLSHYSVLNKSYENGYLFFANYNFCHDNEIQPVLGFAVDYIHFNTQLTKEDVPPLSSLVVDGSIWAFHPTIGISYKQDNYKISPFIGYFNEQVGMIISSPGMLVGKQNNFGFESKSSVGLDYFSIGSKFEITISHFIKLDTKLYCRLRQNEQILWTLRNRLDLYFSKKIGLSVVVDYFQDKYETNSFIFIGPSFVF